MFGLGRKIRYAVVGGGQISQQAFMPGIRRAKNSTLTALVTGDPAKGEALGREYGIAVYPYERYDELLASGTIDAVYVATPNFRHADDAVPALRRGIHVLLEKPMATSLAECERIAAAQRETGAKLMIAYRLHHEPGTIAMITRARAGEFGDLRFFVSAFAQNVAEANSRGQHGYWGGPVPDMGVYPINAVRHLFDAEPVSVHAVGANTAGRGFGFHDTVAVTLRFPGDRLAQLTCSYATAPAEGLTLSGTDATVVSAPCFGYGAGVGITYAVTTAEGETRHPSRAVEQFGGETAYFSQCILDDVAPEADAEEGIMDMRVLDAVERSLRTGETVTIEPARRARRIEADQVRHLRTVDAPDDDELVDVVPQNG